MGGRNFSEEVEVNQKTVTSMVSTHSVSEDLAIAEGKITTPRSGYGGSSSRSWDRNSNYYL